MLAIREGLVAEYLTSGLTPCQAYRPRYKAVPVLNQETDCGTWRCPEGVQYVNGTERPNRP